MKTLCLRHLLLNVRDRATLFLSFASAFVILSLYFLFIPDFMLTAASDMGMPSRWNESFIDSLMLSGLTIVVGATGGLGILSIYIRDRETGILRDFLVAPVSRTGILISYLTAGIFFSFIIMMIVFGISLCLLYVNYEIDYSYVVLLQGTGLLFISAVLSNFVLFTTAVFLKTSSSFSSFGNLYGVVIGFFTGVYIPIGYYPEIIRKISGFFPMAQTASLMRQLMTAPALSQLEAEVPKAAEVLKETFGVHIFVFSKIGIPSLQYFFLFYSILVFILYFILTKRLYLFS